ncbi:putative ATP-dependent endonuclease of OLD family [Marinilabilia salmonicolor]|jgi:predicted ATP-dependent endonuclease of OLD family|uniref:ATP-dependent nuclease n=1 Tax=Marinilabilia salmonicolor TaxID=989 RepID=UPI000D0506CE|nr:AAA family ATPase [Marinilabilia salmonicolor]PRY87676.1 putative ATP-dependent endonuclease of OLD family [Marinilabilia salmonicolor]
MKITKITIENFKSIIKMEFELKKIGGSFTSIFVGINESGKSNLLQALSYLQAPTTKFNFFNLCNQKNEDAKYVDLFYSLEFENPKSYISEINKEIEFDGELSFKIHDIIKNVYLERNKNEFTYSYEYLVSLPKEKLFFKENSKTITVGGVNRTKRIIKISKDSNETESLNELNEESFKELFDEKIAEIINKYEPKVSYWTPSEEYLLSEVNLIQYRENPSSNKPLKNIFHLANINSNENIQAKIDNIKNPQQRSRLVSQLEDSLNDYVKKIWKHEIDIIIDITETGMFSLSIKDKGDENKHDRFSIKDRSEGAKHFLSLILSLSLESKNNARNNELILIDEPEQHMHPSGIRDLSKELLNIGKRNYVFIATHSPFLIDRNNKNRHFIIKKNKKAITEKKNIQEHQTLIDDEVLREAFGVEIYRDLLNPHSLLVEGASDKIILQKSLNVLNKSHIGITNGHGSNIDTLASKLNHENISILVLVDNDQDGQKYKKKILSIGGIYTSDNVFTIRDIVGDVVDGGTIEDLLDKEFIKSQFGKFYKRFFEEDAAEFTIEDNKPVIEQVTIYLKKKRKYSSWDMDLFKKQISDNFNPSKTSLEEKNPLLKSLSENIIEQLES